MIDEYVMKARSVVLSLAVSLKMLSKIVSSIACQLNNVLLLREPVTTSFSIQYLFWNKIMILGTLALFQTIHTYKVRFVTMKFHRLLENHHFKYFNRNLLILNMDTYFNF